MTVRLGTVIFSLTCSMFLGHSGVSVSCSLLWSAVSSQLLLGLILAMSVSSRTSPQRYMYRVYQYILCALVYIPVHVYVLLVVHSYVYHIDTLY